MNDQASTPGQEVTIAGAMAPSSLRGGGYDIAHVLAWEVEAPHHQAGPEDTAMVLMSARGDAVGFEASTPVVLFDWKSDVAPAPDDHDAYANRLLE